MYFPILLIASSVVVGRSLQSNGKQVYFLKKSITLEDLARSVELISGKGTIRVLTNSVLGKVINPGM